MLASYNEKDIQRIAAISNKGKSTQVLTLILNSNSKVNFYEDNENSKIMPYIAKGFLQATNLAKEIFKYDRFDFTLKQIKKKSRKRGKKGRNSNEPAKNSLDFILNKGNQHLLDPLDINNIF